MPGFASGSKQGRTLLTCAVAEGMANGYLDGERHGHGSEGQRRGHGKEYAVMDGMTWHGEGRISNETGWGMGDVRDDRATQTQMRR